MKKYIAKEDFSAAITNKTAKPTVLDPYKEEIRQLIDENAKNWYKQRLTATRIHSLLRQRHPEYQVSYPSLQRYVRMYHRQIRLDQQVGYDRLSWHPGEAQADFGEADFLHTDGSIHRYKFFVMSFPHANKAYVQIYRGENCECVCQALINIFTYLQGIPSFIVFDNANADK